VRLFACLGMNQTVFADAGFSGQMAD